jgi:hypothetical protein
VRLFILLRYSILTITGAASNVDEEVAWDEDSDDEDASTPKNGSGSTTTLKRPKKESSKEKDDTATLKPAEPRRSHDLNSTAGSDASYDIVSGATTPATEMRKVEESDEEDWE